jgi:sulfur dioxygenase
MAGPDALPHPYPRPTRTDAVPLVAPRELERWRGEPDAPLLLDVRPGAERRLARLPGDRSLPLAELPRRFGELDPAAPIVAYCQFGSQARRAARFLRDHGFERAFALEGGIDEYARWVDPSIARYSVGATDGDLLLRQFPRVDSGCLAYLVGDPAARACVVVDPGREVEPYLSFLKSDGWSLKAIVETHTHADHLAGHSALHAKTDAPIVVGRRSPAQYPHVALGDGDRLEFGGEAIEFLETPGHTRDHVTLRVRDKIFTGDTLLLGSCGRTDLGDGDPNLLWESLTTKLLPLGDAVEVYPAHYGRRHALPERYVSSLGFEKGTNEALLQPTREAFLAYMTDGWPPKPAEFDRIVHENLTR